MEACEIFSHKKFREKVLGMEACEMFFPTKKLGRRFLEWKLVRFFSHKKFREKVLGMEACEILSHKKFRGKVPGMETCEIFFLHKNEKEQVPRM